MPKPKPLTKEQQCVEILTEIINRFVRVDKAGETIGRFALWSAAHSMADDAYRAKLLLQSAMIDQSKKHLFCGSQHAAQFVARELGILTPIQMITDERHLRGLDNTGVVVHLVRGQEEYFSREMWDYCKQYGIEVVEHY